MSSELVFLLLSIFGIAGFLLGQRIGLREGYQWGFMDGHERAMKKMTSNVRVLPKNDVLP